jgi:hypothetical protein
MNKCTDCPQLAFALPGDIKEPNIRYIHHAGDNKQFYAALEKTISEEEITNGRPTIHEDGSVEFPLGDPPDLHGYKRDETNRQLFHPLWPECVKRVVGTFVNEGRLGVIARCNNLRTLAHLKLEKSSRENLHEAYKQMTFTKAVTPEQCAACPCRELVPPPAPRTLKESYDQFQSAARKKEKQALGSDIYERADGIIKKWAQNRINQGAKP